MSRFLWSYEHHPENGDFPHICVGRSLGLETVWFSCRDEQHARFVVALKSADQSKP